MSFFEATFKKYPRWVNASSTIQITPKRCSTLRHLTTWCRLRPEMARLPEHFRLYGLLLALLSNERLVDVRDHTSASNSGLDKWVQLLVSSDGQLQVAWSYTLHFKILWSISCQLQNLGSEVFEDSRAVHRCGGSHSAVACGPGLEVSVDTTHRELQSCSLRARNSLRLGLPGVFTCLTTSHI